jgi:hypothetical protein
MFWTLNCSIIMCCHARYICTLRHLHLCNLDANIVVVIMHFYDPQIVYWC